jgi:hypothetical protein
MCNTSRLSTIEEQVQYKDRVQYKYKVQYNNMIYINFWKWQDGAMIRILM